MLSGYHLNNSFEFFHNSRLIRRIEQIKFWQKWGLSPGYPDHIPTTLTITPHSQLYLG